MPDKQSVLYWNSSVDERLFGGMAIVIRPHRTMEPAVKKDRWTSTALPILQHIATIEGVEDQITVGELAELTGASPREVEIEVDRLREEGLLGGGEFAKFMTGGDVTPYILMMPRLTASGCRAVGAWPSEPFGNAFIEALQQAAEEATEPEERTRLQKALAAVKDVGVTVVTEVAVAATKQSMGLG